MKSRLFYLLIAFLTLGNFLSAQDGYQWVNSRHRNPTKGGWVSNGAFVEEGVFIAPSARVEGSATITGSARIYGNAVVRGQATVEGNARIYGNAIIEGNAMVGDKAQVFDHAKIGGDAFIGGEARVGGYSRITTGQTISGFLRPPQPAAEVAAAQRADQQQARAQALANQRNALLIRLDRAIQNINQGFSKRYRDGGSLYSKPNISRQGMTLTFATEQKNRWKDEYGGEDFRPRNYYETQNWKTRATIAQIKPGTIQGDRTSRYDKTTPTYYEFYVSFPDKSVQYSKVTNYGNSQNYRTDQESLVMFHSSKSAVEEFTSAIKALQVLENS